MNHPKSLHLNKKLQRIARWKTGSYNVLQIDLIVTRAKRCHHADRCLLSWKMKHWDDLANYKMMVMK